MYIDCLKLQKLSNFPGIIEKFTGSRFSDVNMSWFSLIVN